MPKYEVIGIATVTIKLGEYEADSEEEAYKMSEEDPEADWYPTLCWHCSETFDLSDINEIQVNIIED